MKMSKPYDHYEAGEVVEVCFYSANNHTKEIVKLSETPKLDESSNEWIVTGYRRKNSKSFYELPTKWWAHSISSRPFS